MARDDLHFKLRIPASLKARIEAAAGEAGRSMTAEINYRVEASYEIGETLSRIDAKMDQLISRIDAIDRRESKG